MFVQKSQGHALSAVTHFFLENCLWLPGIYLNGEDSGTSLDFLLKFDVASSVSREARYGLSVVITR